MKEITEVFPEGSLEFWRQKARKLQAALERAEARNDRTYCAYCGAEFPLDDDAASRVTEHVRTCDKHPMRSVERERDAYRKACQTAVHALMSYQYGNGSPDLAEQVAKNIQALLVKHTPTEAS